MNLTIIGSGYVGLTTGTCLPKWAITSFAWIIIRKNTYSSIRGHPHLRAQAGRAREKNVAVGRLEFSPSIAASIAESEVIFIAVPTPPNTDGSVDLTYIEKWPGKSPRRSNQKWDTRSLWTNPPYPSKPGKSQPDHQALCGAECSVRHCLQSRIPEGRMRRGRPTAP